MESDPTAVANRVAVRSDDIPLGEQTVASVRIAVCPQDKYWMVVAHMVMLSVQSSLIYQSFFVSSHQICINLPEFCHLVS